MLPMLSVRDLACRRGGLPVLRGVSFDCAAGEALVLRGPNGIGKTTLLRTVAGLQPAAGGTITAPEEGIAYAGHADGLKAALSVRANLAFWASVYGTRDIAPALAAFDLEPLLDRAAADLSAGQKRRLGLARMTVTGRPVWIFDEPTVSLDTANVALFAGMVQRHLAAGGVALMATHIDIGIAAGVLDLTPYRVTEAEAEAGDDPFLAEAL